MPRVTLPRQAASASGDFSPILAANTSASFKSSSCGTTALISPKSWAFAALIGSPVSIIRSARLRPTRRGSRCEPPNGGANPSVISALQKLRPLARDRQRRRFGDFASSAVREPVHGDDDRLGKRLDPRRHLLTAAHELAQRHLLTLPHAGCESGDIRAGGKRLVAGAGQDYD